MPHRTGLRRFALVLGLLTLLFGADRLYIAADGWQPITEAAPDTVLYAAGFEAFEDDWQQYTGSEEAIITDGVLRMGNDIGTFTYSATEPKFASLDLTVRATAIAGSDNNAFGVVYRLKEARDCDLPSLVLCDLAGLNRFIDGMAQGLLGTPQVSEYRAFLISSDGYYGVFRSGPQNIISQWIPNPDVIETGLNAENEIRVRINGERVRFYINGQMVPLCLPDDPDGLSTVVNGECFGGSFRASYQETELTSGRVALAVDAARSEPGFAIEFDNLVITMPGADSDPASSTPTPVSPAIEGSA